MTRANIYWFSGMCSLDSKNCNFRYKDVTSNICTCNQVQNVEHVLLHCNYPVLSDNRETFHKKYCQYVKHFNVKNNHDQIAEILNLNPSCSQEHKYKPVECVCTFIKKAYFILNIMLNNNNWQDSIIYFTDQGLEIPVYLYYLLTMVLTWNVCYFMNKTNLYSSIPSGPYTKH